MRISDWSSVVCSSDLVCPSAPHRRAASLLVRRSLRSALQWRKSYASCLTIASIRHRPTVSDPDSGDRRHIAQVSNKAPWGRRPGNLYRSEEHTSELQSLMRISYAVFCVKKHKNTTT